MEEIPKLIEEGGTMKDPEAMFEIVKVELRQNITHALRRDKCQDVCDVHLS